MAWSSPPTAVAGAAIPAAWWNTYIRDNLLVTAPAVATASGRLIATDGPNSIAERVPTSAVEATVDTTTATAFGDLATTSGPAATFTSGTRALILISGSISNNTVNADTYMSVAISGATTSSPTSSTSLILTSATANARVNASLAAIFTLTAGSNTATAKYQVSSGTGTYGTRRVLVIPF